MFVMVEVSPDIRKSFGEGLVNILNEIFEEDISGYRTVVVKIEGVGASFEPRTKFIYDKYHGKEYLGRDSKTVIFEKDGETIVSVFDD